MSRVTSSFTIREELKRQAERAIKEGLFPGITSLSGLIEYALQKVLREVGRV